MINDSHIIVKIKWLSFQLFIINIYMCVVVILIGVAQCVSPWFFQPMAHCAEKHFLFCAPLNIKPFHKKVKLIAIPFFMVMQTFWLKFA